MRVDWQAVVDAQPPIRWRLFYLAAAAYYGWLVLFQYRDLVFETAAPTLMVASMCLVAFSLFYLAEHYDRYQDELSDSA